MIIIFSKKLVKIFSFGNADAITLCPFILLSRKETEAYIINHEKIHIRQQLELLIIPFYILYGLEFIYFWFRYKNRKEAYMSISFEREAYANHYNLNYLENRSFLSSLKHLKSTKEQG